MSQCVLCCVVKHPSQSIIGGDIKAKFKPRITIIFLPANVNARILIFNCRPDYDPLY